MDYRLNRARRKTLALKIDPADLSVVVSAPWWVTKREIDTFVAKHEDWIRKHRAVLTERQEREAAVTEEDIARWKARARAELPPKILYYAALMGVRPTGFRVTSAAKRFGSCSGKNSLSFSYRLMAYPEAAIDYVVVHELAHIRHHNHSRDFYALVESILPDYQARERLLKQPLPIITVSDD